jgi:hypothetical protein
MALTNEEARTTLLTKITMAFGLVVAVLATIPAPAGPRDGGQAAFSYNDNPRGMASGSGNLVPLW